METPKGSLATHPKTAPVLADENAHRYEQRLQAGQVLDLRWRGHHLDLDLWVTGPGLSQPLTANGFSGQEGLDRFFSEGFDRFCFEAPKAGLYGFSLRRKSTGPGRYDLTVNHHRAPHRKLRLAASGYRLLAEARAAETGSAEAEALLIEAHQQAIQADDPILEVEAAAELGWFLHNSRDDETAAMVFLSRAAHAAHDSGDALRAARLYCDLALLQAPQGADRAEVGFKRALRAAMASGSDHMRSYVLGHYAWRLNRWGRFQEAIDHYDQALDLADPRWPDLAATWREELASCYSLHGRVELARDLLHQALAHWREREYTERQRGALNEIGWAWYVQKRYMHAVSHYREALSLPALAGHPLRLAGTHDRLGSAYRELARFEDARESYHRALALLPENGEGAAHIHANLGELYLQWGRPRPALKHATLALGEFSKSGQRFFRANALMITGRAQTLQGDPVRAWQAMETAVRQIRLLRENTSNATQIIFFTSASYDFDLHYLQTLLEHHPTLAPQARAAAAFEYLESVRAFSLRRRAGRPDNAVTDPESEHEAETLSREINRLEFPDSPVDGPARGGRIRHLLTRLEKLRAQAEQKRRRSKTDTPRFSLTDIQQELLDADSLILCYSLGQPKSYLWVIDSENCRLVSLPPREDIAFQVDNYLSQVSLRNHGAADHAARLGGILSRTLLAPARPWLAGKDLLIIKDGVLHDLPFGVLEDPGHPGQPLIAAHDIAATPSAGHAILMRRRFSKMRPSKPALVLADPVYDRRDGRLRPAAKAGPAPNPAIRTYTRLRHSASEAKTILELMPQALVLTGTAASKTALYQADLGTFGVLHLGVHGMFHEREPRLSGMVLSLFDGLGRPVDGHLRAHELANLNMVVPLVVLSGCKTALGPKFRGEGPWALGRQFMAAGAGRVVVSLWDVDDRATAQLMEAFYRFLWREQLAPSAALRRAQNLMRSHGEFADPYYWAGFEVQGGLRDFWSKKPTAH